MLEVTNVTVRKYNNGKLRGFANVTFNDTISWNNLKIYEGQNGFFVRMPAEYDKKGKTNEDGSPKSYPIIFINFKTPSGKALIEHITEEVMKAYNNNSGQQQRQDNGSQDEVADEDIPF